MKNFMLIIIVSLVCLHNLSGCATFNDYDYREEELSKSSGQPGNAAEEDGQYEVSVAESVYVELDCIKVHTGETLYNGSEIWVYGYTFRAGKAFLYAVIPHSGILQDFSLTFELFYGDESLGIVDSTYDYVAAGAPILVSIEADERVTDIRLVSVKYNSVSDALQFGGRFNFEDDNNFIELQRLSNTTFDYSSKKECILVLFNADGVQVDCLKLIKGKGQLVTVHEAVSFNYYYLE